jgi:hypothetical protein
MREYYKNEELEEARRDFERVFKMDFEPYYMKSMSGWAKHVCLDLNAFKEMLHSLYGYEDCRGELNLENLLREIYGEEGVKLFFRLL